MKSTDLGGTELGGKVSTSPADFESQVRDALELVRPAIQMDGGDIQLESVEGGKVTVQLFGTCETCPLTPVTLKQGVERILRDQVPGVTEVVAVEA